MTANPETPSALLELPVFGGRSTRRHVDVWFEALRTAATLPESELPQPVVGGDGPPAANRWAERDPVAARRLARVRAAVAAVAEQHALPPENLLQPEALRRLAWSPPEHPDTEHRHPGAARQRRAPVAAGAGRRAGGRRTARPAARPVVTLPRLHGPRLVLVPVDRPVAEAVVAGDTARLSARLAEQDLHRGPGWPHPDTVDALRPLAEHDGAGTWLVVDGDAVVGDCGWLGGPDATGDAEIGYGLAAPSRRQGLGTEAVALLAAWAEQQAGVHRVVAEVLQGNEASRRLLHRLGFEEEDTLPPYVRYVRSRSPRRRVAGRHVC